MVTMLFDRRTLEPSFSSATIDLTTIAWLSAALDQTLRETGPAADDQRNGADGSSGRIRTYDPPKAD